MSEGSHAAVELKAVFKRFGTVVAVQEMDLKIPEGSLVTLLGPSGCGKTTILRMIAGLEKPTEGDIYIKGKRVNDVPVHKRNLGMIFQNYALFPHRTIFDNVAFGLKYRNFARDEIRLKVQNALEMVRLPGVEDRMPSQLSGGQQQRIALARAIVIEPDVLLMDEPLSALDENLREDMRREVANLQKLLGITTVFVTHDQREALSMSDKIVVMREGKKQQEGSPEHTYNYPVNHFVAAFLGHPNFFGGVVSAAKGDSVKVRIEDGSELWVESTKPHTAGSHVEVVVRAQSFKMYPMSQHIPEPETYCFRGKVKDRSYMGGEVRHFVEVSGGSVVQVIGGMTSAGFRPGDEVVLEVDPGECRVLVRNGPSPP